MASTRKQVVSSKITEDRQRYHRAIAINSELASECLRKMAEKFLDIANVKLHEHLSQSCVKEMFKKCNLSKEQKALITSPLPDLNMMDITVLCVLLLKTNLPLTSDDRKYVEGIKGTRNSLSHIPDGMLPTDTIFNMTSQLILSIAKNIDPNFYRSMTVRVNEIHGRELVRTISTIARLEMGESVYVLKLLETGTDSTDVPDNELLIRLNLSRFSRQIARSVCPTELLKRLKENDPTLAERLQFDQQCYSREFQMSDIIVKITTEPKYELMKFCKFLRLVSPPIADLVENTNTDGQSTLEYLKKEELSKIQDILHKTLQEDGKSSITSEELHVLFEQEMKFSIQFNLIQQCILEGFPGVQFDEKTLSFRGLFIERRGAQESGQPHCIPGHVRLHEQTTEEFGEYVASTLRELKIVDTPFKTAVIDHSLSALTFIKLTTEQMEEIFIPYLTKFGKLMFGMGMKIAMTEIQSNIKRTLIPPETTHSKSLQVLRQFETPVENTRYSAGIVRPQQGNLLVPTHEFISNVYDRTTLLPNHVIAKLVVRFTAACMNERQNGTIHFGIEQIGNNEGKITGVSDHNVHRDQLDGDLFEAFRCSFGDVVSIALRCILPVQYVPVEGGNVVIEIDVVPFSRYLTQNLLSIRYPPKGSQLQKYFVMNHNRICEKPENEAKSEDVQNVYNVLSKQREHFEEARTKTKVDTQHLQTVFGELLTRGYDNVTNHLTPVIVSGQVSQCEAENIIRSELFCEQAFTSSRFVLDFDSSSALRESVENDESMFEIQVAEKHKESFIRDEHENKQLPVWLYCNGCNDNELPSTSFEEWMKKRKHGVFNALNYLRKHIQAGRGILIFLIFDAPKHRLKPILELARQALLHVFTEECLIVSHKEECVSYLKSEVKSAFGETAVERTFITGLPWREVSRVVNSVFKQKADVICRLPCSRGHFHEMTFKEKHLLTDLCIISGEECQHEEYLMNDVTKRKHHRKCKQEEFYRGSAATWWNFYYNHVGKRFLFGTYQQLIIDKLCNGHDFVEKQVIQHHPGAGGSTFGKHLIWEISQFNGNPDSSYRCCVVKSITNNTAKQIEELRSFKDSEKPVIILIDNKDEDIDELVENLNHLASKSGRSGVVYYLVLHVQRVEIWQKDSIPHVLKHELRQSEKNWFEEKYNEMQKSTINVDTLIAFNCMRNSFNEDYVRDTTYRLMKGVTKNEIEVLNCLALIRSFEINKAVSHEIVDDMLEVKYPPHLSRLHKSNSSPKTSFNEKITRAMSLLVMPVGLEDIGKWEVSVISMSLSNAILEYLYGERKMSLESVVNCALEKYKNKMNDKSQMSKLYREIICSVFETRLSIRGDKRRKFSELVLQLDEEFKGNVGKAAAFHQVLRVVKNCFDLTNDPMVGRQIARFYLHRKQFDDAEQAILRALQLMPKQSCLFHTYGCILKSKMEYMEKNCLKTKNEIPDEAAAEIIAVAFKGIEVSQRDTHERSFACFELEVNLILSLLQIVELFSSFQDRNTGNKILSKFLSDQNFDVKSSILQNLLVLCPQLEGLRVGMPMQMQMESSLRFLEDNPLKLSSKLVKNISNLRSRLSHFYRNLTECSNNRGSGFKHLQDALLDCPLDERVDLAKRNMERQQLMPTLSGNLSFKVDLRSRFRSYRNLTECSSDPSSGFKHLEALLLDCPRDERVDLAIRNMERQQLRPTLSDLLSSKLGKHNSNLRSRFSSYRNLTQCSSDRSSGFKHLQDALLDCPLDERVDLAKRNMERQQLRPTLSDLRSSKLGKHNSNLRSRFSSYRNLTECSSDPSSGFKHLQDALFDCPLDERVDLANRNMERQMLRPRMSDLLGYLRTKILQFGSCPTCDDDEFKKLLSFSARLHGARVHTELIGEKSYYDSHLYYALLHWPLDSRLRFDELAKPYEFITYMKIWQESVRSKYSFNTETSKELLVIVDGTPGNDFLLYHQTQKRNNGERKNLRHDGFVDATGCIVKVRIIYPVYGVHILKIKSQNCALELCLRRVTFVLGFTRKGPVALDLREKAIQAVGEPKLYPSYNNQSKTATNNSLPQEKTGSKVKHIVMAIDNVDSQDETEHDDKSKRKRKTAVEEPNLYPSCNKKSKTATNNSMPQENTGSKVKQIVMAIDKVDSQDETKHDDKSKRKRKPAVEEPNLYPSCNKKLKTATNNSMPQENDGSKVKQIVMAIDKVDSQDETKHDDKSKRKRKPDFALQLSKMAIDNVDSQDETKHEDNSKRKQETVKKKLYNLNHQKRIGSSDNPETASPGSEKRAA